MEENKNCKIIIKFNKDNGIQFTCIPESKQFEQIQKEWKRCTIQFDRNEIVVGEEDGIDILKTLIEEPRKFKTIPMLYQQKEYNLLPETLLSFIIKEFIDNIGKNYIVNKTEVIIENEINPIVKERLYESIDNLYLQHDLIENSSLKDKE